MVYLINYRLHTPGKNYTELYDAIKSISGTYWNNTTSAWVVVSSMSASQIANQLRAHIDDNDELAIFRITDDWYGFLQSEDIEWLRSIGL